MVWDESNIVTERENTLLLTQSNLMQAVISSILSKKGGARLKKLSESLNVETRPFEGPIEGHSDGDDDG